MIQSVIVTGDCLRPNPDGSLGAINTPTKWLHRLLEYQLRLATNLPVRALLLDSVNGIDALGLYRRLEMHDRLAGWTTLYDGSRHLGELVRLFEPVVRNAVVVGFELPKYLQRVLEVLSVPYVDLWVHPVRFLDDLLFGIRSTDPAGHARLADYTCPEDRVWMTAGQRRATVLTGPDCYLEPNSTLVLGQSRTDKSQVRNGRFADARDFDAELTALAAKPGGWLLKPHPADSNHTLMDRVRELVPRARTVSDNVYYLLAQDAIERVVSLNSSAATEARYFGKAVTTFLPPVIDVAYRADPLRPTAYWSVGHQFLDPDFWRSVLGSVLLTTPPDGFRHEPKPNRFRTSLRSFWGFQEIDADIVTNLARPLNPETAQIRPATHAGQRVNVLPLLVPVSPADVVAENRYRFLPSRSDRRLVLCGPYFPAAPGRYRVTVEYRLLTPAQKPDEPFSLDVCHEFGNRTTVPLRGCAADRDENGGHSFAVEFDLSEAIPNLEIRLWTGTADVLVTAVTLDWLAVRPVTA